MNHHIALIDPSLRDNNGNISLNLGDVIIYEAVNRVLRAIFPGQEILRISAHQDIGRKEKAILKSAALSFVGGTNILTSDVRHFNRLSPKKTKGFYFYPGFKNLVLLGTAWAAYEKRPD